MSAMSAGRSPMRTKRQDLGGVMNDFDTTLNVEGAPDAQLLSDIKEMIVKAESERPRSLQRVPGPSEVGHPCLRHLAFTVNRARSEVPAARGYNINSDPMPAIVGTAVHASLETAALAANKRLGRVRWVTEQRVVVRPQSADKDELAGTCDLYDFDTSSTLDWKVPGATAYAKYVKNGPSEQYRGQAHLYGQGYINLGFKVEQVGIVFISRTGTLRQIHIWREPFDPALVQDILGKLDAVETVLDENGQDGLSIVPITPGDYCNYCNWFSVNPHGLFQCGGR